MASTISSEDSGGGLRGYITLQLSAIFNSSLASRSKSMVSSQFESKNTHSSKRNLALPAALRSKRDDGTMSSPSNDISISMEALTASCGS